MPPFIPVIGLSRSQRIRLGRGPGDSLLREIYGGDLAVNPQNNRLNILFYANLGDPNVRKDYQHHSAIGGLESIGNLSLTVTSDMYMDSGQFQGSNGTGLAVNVSAGNLRSRTFGGVLDVPAVTNLALAANTSGLSRTDAVFISSNGAISVATGTPAAAAAFEVDSVATTGVPTGGTFTLSFTYNGQAYTTAPIAYNAAATAVASAVQNAAGLPGTWTGTGGALPTAVTLTNSGTAVGLSNLSANYSGLTGGTNPTATFTQTTAGSPGPVAPVISGNNQTLFTVVVANGATSPGTIVQNVIPTS